MGEERPSALAKPSGGRGERKRLRYFLLPGWKEEKEKKAYNSERLSIVRRKKKGDGWILLRLMKGKGAIDSPLYMILSRRKKEKKEEKTSSPCCAGQRRKGKLIPCGKRETRRKRKKGRTPIKASIRRKEARTTPVHIAGEEKGVCYIFAEKGYRWRGLRQKKRKLG